MKRRQTTSVAQGPICGTAARLCFQCTLGGPVGRQKENLVHRVLVYLTLSTAARSVLPVRCRCSQDSAVPVPCRRPPTPMRDPPRRTTARTGRPTSPACRPWPST